MKIIIKGIDSTTTEKLLKIGRATLYRYINEYEHIRGRGFPFYFVLKLYEGVVVGKRVSMLFLILPTIYYVRESKLNGWLKLYSTSKAIRNFHNTIHIQTFYYISYDSKKIVLFFFKMFIIR